METSVRLTISKLFHEAGEYYASLQHLDFLALALFCMRYFSSHLQSDALEDGAGTRSRTRDLLITSQLLYQLSYAGNGKTCKQYKLLQRERP